ncbi:MAG TPA: TIGR03435 family protein [Phycisphaerae bacterium]|jgi:uncharacterized protein (TIGR03435 family)
MSFARFSAVALVLASTFAHAHELAAAPKPGEQAPQIALERLLQAPDGAQSTLAALKGKVVVLEFWATWCAPCVASIPHMNALADAFKDQPIQFISITSEEELKIRKFLVKKPIHGWVGLDTDESVFHAYGIQAIPRTVLLDQDGRFVGELDPGSLNVQILDALLASKKPDLPPPAPAGMRIVPGIEPGSTDGRAPLYEVLIRPTSGGAGAGGSASGSGKLTIHATPLADLVAQAYGVPRTRLINRLPPSEELYDVVMVLPEARSDEMYPLLQRALETTFKLRCRREERETEVILMKRGPAVEKRLSTTASTGGVSVSNGPGRLECVNVDAPTLASNLESALKKPVIDETQLAQHYDVDLEWDAEDPKAVIAATREKLGLELSPEHRRIEFLLVEPVGSAETDPATDPARSRD